MESFSHLSVIIPAYQEEKLIARMLGQFTAELRRKYRFEVIVSDGGSKDKTVCLARNIADLVVEARPGSKENISIGRNRGARSSCGEFLFFLNADTIIEDPEKFFPTMIDALRRDGIAAATCNVAIYPDEENLADRLFHGFCNWYFSLLNNIGMGMGRGECHVMKREVYEQAGGYDESIAAGEDYELFLRLRRIGKIAYVHTLSVFESPRRFRRYGYLSVSFLWFINALTVLIFRRSVFKQWKPVR